MPTAVAGAKASVLVTSRAEYSRGMRLIIACTIICAAVAGFIQLVQEPSYRARAYVIQVPSDLGGDAGLELARSDRVLRRALVFAATRRMSAAELRDRSKAEITSRLDLAFTVEAPSAQQAVALATGYAKAFRRAIPDDEGLPVRGRGALKAQPGLGAVGWGFLGGVLGAALGTALVLVRDGRRRARAQRVSATSLPARSG